MNDAIAKFPPDLGRIAGIATAAELMGSGLTESGIRTMVKRGELRSLRRGVYAKSTVADGLARRPGGSHLLKVAAAVAAMGPGSVGSHRDAATIHGLDLLGRPSSQLVSVCRRPGDAGTRSNRPGIKLHVASMPVEHRVIRSGLPVTSVARTVIDLARMTSFKEGVVIADSALRQSLTTKDELRAVIGVCARWRGAAQARQVIEFSDGLSESAFESVARVMFHLGGLPAPELQAWVGGDGIVIGRADFYWPSYATIAEADGASKYADPNRARMQLERDARLRETGFEVVHFGWRELHLNPGQVIASIRAAFHRGVALRSAGARPRPPG